MNLKESYENPLVSVIVLTYNSEDFITETLESIKEQTYKRLELIIADDYSADNTSEICNAWLKNNNERFVKAKFVQSNKNTGTSINLNRGIRSSNGTWIKIIAGDDVLEKRIIERYINYSYNHPEVEFLHSQVQHYNEEFTEENKLPFNDAKKYKINQPTLSARDQFYILLRSCVVAAPTVMIKVSVFQKVGLFEEKYPLWEDRPMWLKITNNNIKLEFVDVIGAYYRERNNSVARIKSNNSFLSSFGLYKARAYQEFCIPFLPFYERLIKMTSFRINIFIHNIGNKSIFLKLFHKIIAIPLLAVIRMIDKRYE